MLNDSIRQWNPWWADAESIKQLGGIERKSLKSLLKLAALRHIKDITGIRRAGKSTMMYQVISAMISHGAKPKEIAFLNFDDAGINEASFDEILDSLDKISPDIKFLFLDEVQEKHGWERWARTLYDTRRYKQTFVSGSSASVLSKDIGRVMTGRHISFHVWPLSFMEYLIFHGWEKFDIGYLESNKSKILHYQEGYLKDGGFPETILKTDAEKKIILTNIYNDILSRDIAARHNASYETAKLVSYHLLSNMTKEFSYRSIATAVGIKPETADIYTGYLKEALMVLALDFFSFKTKIQFKQNKKAYCIDNGLRNAVSFRITEDKGRLMENAVMVELARRGRDVYYWKTKDGKEVDFLIKEGTKVKELLQVCFNANEPQTKKRELNSLIEAMKEFKLKTGIVITEDKEMEERVSGKTIRFLPLWKWLLCSQ
ncbi:MAG: ATP-binding protein [Nanoarchaeota archaeon]|nr:ATP-binding protein [Nanoarchaeota archaeon]